MTVFTMDDLYRKMYDLKLLIRNILIKSKRTWDEPRPCWEFSRVEATEDGRYFIVGHGDLEVAGLQTRYRE